jgi:MFS family permease
MSLILLTLPPIARPGRALLGAVAVFGLATIVFGFSRWFPLSLAAFVVAGMADQISMVTRQMIIQLATPDALRGRVSSVNLLFIGASNQLGAAESGFVAALTSATFAVVSGGLGCLAVLAVVALRLPALRKYRLGQESLDAVG